MKRTLFTHLMLAAMLVLATSCQNENGLTAENNPFDPILEKEQLVRNKIVVISDLHLGADLSYSECVHHLPRLTQFLNEIHDSKTVKELVIAGDMLDEWYVPSRDDTYQGSTQLEFVRKIASVNSNVVDILNEIIQDGEIKVTYTPGNHDLLIPEVYVADIFPGINQARDAGKLGIGTYHPDGYPQIAIEHGNRFDFFCSPDPYSNQDIAPGSILPPGYFFTRIAVNSILNRPTTAEITPVRTVTLNSADSTQLNAYIYYNIWKYVLASYIPVKDNFDEKIIVTHLGHYNDTVRINDIIPFNTESGTIDMKLYSGICNQQTWENRLRYNNVPVKTLAKEAIPGSLQTEFLDNQSNVQFFQNDSSNVRIVVFGHTHNPMIKLFSNVGKGECLYANAGTWIDKKIKNGETVDQDVENMNFVVLMPQSIDNTMMKVERFNYRNGKHISIESKSIKL